ncbi:DUF2179 domain-containing protein [Paenibacillus sp. GP183]|uniref:DUF2179 domain-containing protein n=1 Tax=Paenibacillus sp. GP183 TaxID=1882751 RepID=UPI000894F828|nr:DUF2179 domain-containing protein [Paenibacillus sp. GP183]SEB99720.1 Uncharacterized protein YebE, UPF0316 family [Paenibacillus sp. GP183]
MTTLLFILALQVTYVSLLTIRFILMVKGFRYIAALMSAVEIGIYVIGFKIVLDHLHEPVNLIVYCLSYGLGILLGTKIEERLALGFVTIQAVTNAEFGHMTDDLRSKGYGVTVWQGEGKEGSRWIISVVLHRKEQHQLYQEILAIDPQAFVVSYEPNLFHGGFLVKKRHHSAK